MISSTTSAGLDLSRDQPLPDVGRDPDVLAHRQEAEQLEPLERAGEAPAGALGRAEVGDVAAVELDPARVRAGSSPVMTLNSVVLPAPFGPDEAGDAAGLGRDADLVERDVAAEADGDVADLKRTPWSSASLRPISRSSSSRSASVHGPVDAPPLERDVGDRLGRLARGLLDGLGLGEAAQRRPATATAAIDDADERPVVDDVGEPQRVDRRR